MPIQTLTNRFIAVVEVEGFIEISMTAQCVLGRNLKLTELGKLQMGHIISERPDISPRKIKSQDASALVTYRKYEGSVGSDDNKIAS